MENAYYSVITPEGCAAILWRSADAIPKAAQALKLTGRDLMKLGVVDGIIPEPLGGAHHDPAGATDLLKQAIVDQLDQLCTMPGAQLRQARYDRFRDLGVFSV